jgi:WD40 repeat protein
VFVWDHDGSAWNAREVEDVVAFFPEALDISPDGRYVATVQVPVPVYEEGSVDWYVTLVDLEADPPAVRYLDHAPAMDARFAPDGRSVVSLESETATATVVDIETAEVLSTTDLGVDDAWDVVLQQSPDRRLVVASFFGEQSTVVALEAETGRPVWRSVEADEVVGAVDSEGARVALGHADGRVEVVDLATGERAELEGPVQDGVGSVQWSPDGSVVLGTTADRTVLLWDAETGALRSRLGGHWGDLSGAVFAQDGTTVYSAGRDRAVLAWDLTGGRGVVRDVPTGTGRGPKGSFFSLMAAMTPDGRIAATALEDDVVRVVDTTGGEEFEVSVREDAVAWLTVDRDGRYVLVHTTPDVPDAEGSLQITIRVLDVQARRLLPTAVSLRAGLGWEAVTTADNASILTSEDEVLRLWDLETGDLVDDDLFRAGGTVAGIVVSPEGRLAVLNNGEVVDVTAGRLVADLGIDQFDEAFGLTAMAFSGMRHPVWASTRWSSPRTAGVSSRAPPAAWLCCPWRTRAGAP